MIGSRSMLTICRFGGEFGWGHLTRCSVLNAEAKERGWTTQLVTSSAFSGIPKDLQQPFDSVHQVSEIGNIDSYGKLIFADAVLVDDMYLSQAYFDTLSRLMDSRGGAPIIALDDLRQRPLRSVALAVNSELGLRDADYQAGKNLLGEKFALIRKDFRSARPYPFPLSEFRRPIFVMIGGTDPKGVVLAVLAALKEVPQIEFSPIVVSGDGSRRNEIVEKLKSFSEYKFLEGVNGETVANWVATAQVAIVGCGTTVYELAALGKRFLGLVVANNQRTIASRIESLWGLPTLEQTEDGALELGIAAELRRLFVDGGYEIDWVASDVDLKGGQRVFDEIEDLIR